MNIRLLKRIDYWLGIPLCFLLSALNHIQGGLGLRRRRIRPVKKIAFIKLPELGAIILAYPLISRVKKEHPGAELFFVTFEKNKGLFKLLGGIIPEGNILGIRQSCLFFAIDTLKAIAKLRKKKIDIIFDLEFFARFSALFSYLSAAAKKAGFYGYAFEGLYRGNFLTHKIQYNPLEHISRNYLSFARVIADEEKNTPELSENIAKGELVFPRYAPQVALKGKISGKLKELNVSCGKDKIFLLNPGEGILPLREWPLDYFLDLSRMILKDSSRRIIIVGTDHAAEKARLIMERIKDPRCASLVDQTGLEELLTLFHLADLLISNDCGLSHLAMLTDIKKIVIFGPESPRVFAPLGHNTRIVYSNWPCSPCLSALNHRDSNCIDNKCLKAIKPEEVFSLIMGPDPI